jgi:hypothetical protein
MNHGHKILLIKQKISNEHVFHQVITIYPSNFIILKNSLSYFFFHFSIHPKQRQSAPLYHPDLLQRWLEDQLNQFRCQIKQTPPSNRYSTTVNDSTDDESDTLHENTFPILSTKSKKRPYHHIRYKSLRKTTHLVRHESLNDRNRTFTVEDNQKTKVPKRTDSSSIPTSDQSDISSTRPDHLSEGVLSNHESEYDNMYTQNLNSNKTTKLMNNSQILTDNESDDETTLATTINRRYF